MATQDIIIDNSVATSDFHMVNLKENMSSNSRLSLRSAILIGVCLQNAGYTLIRKYSTQTENVSSKEVLLVAEAIKLLIATWLTVTSTEKSDSQGVGVDKLIWLLSHSGKMLVLAAIYGMMNILSFVALQYIGAGEFTICAQLKILTTAAFSVIIMRTTLSWARWRALALLVLGCILVASPSFTGNDKTGTVILQVFGYGAVLTEVALSGFASIYFEKVVKSTSEVVTIWERNFQLGVYSIIIYTVIICYEGSNATNARAPWSNWSFLTVMVSVFGAAGGLLVAATLKYADSIMKTLAAAGAIVLSTVLGNFLASIANSLCTILRFAAVSLTTYFIPAGHFFLDGPLDLIVVIGGACTMIAIANYTLDSTPTVIVSSPKPIEDEDTKSVERA